METMVIHKGSGRTVGGMLYLANLISNLVGSSVLVTNVNSWKYFGSAVLTI